VEFADFRCRYCRAAGPVLERIHAAYPREVRIVFKHLPVVSEASGRAAIAALAAQRQGRFWEMHDVLFEHQDQPLTEPLLRREAGALGLDLERFSADLRSEQLVAVVNADLSEADRLGIQGTPAFFVNGRPLAGWQSFEALRSVIEEELARTR
jgi:protein-disulfide isomerase